MDLCNQTIPQLGSIKDYNIAVIMLGTNDVIRHKTILETELEEVERSIELKKVERSTEVIEEEKKELDHKLNEYLNMKKGEIFTKLANTSDYQTSEQIAKSIKFIHEILHSNNIKTIAVSIPPFDSESKLAFNKEGGDQLRRDVNTELKAYVEHEPNCIDYVDVAHKPNSVDGLHYDKKGYEELATAIAETVKIHLNIN